MAEFFIFLGIAAAFGLVMGLLHRFAPRTAQKIEQELDEQKELERLRRLNSPTDAEMKANMQRVQTNWNRIADKDKRI